MTASSRRRRPRRRTFRFRKTVDAPLRFVFRWCTDYREDDDRLTNDLYHYRAEIPVRESRHLVRLIRVPGSSRRPDVELEWIELWPPDRWRVRMVSREQDRNGTYRLRRLGTARTRLDMRFHEVWRSTPSAAAAYAALFRRVWDRYVECLETDYRATRSRPSYRDRRG